MRLIYSTTDMVLLFADGSEHALMTGTPTPRSTDGRETALRVSVGVTVFST